MRRRPAESRSRPPRYRPPASSPTHRRRSYDVPVGRRREGDRAAVGERLGAVDEARTGPAGRCPMRARTSPARPARCRSSSSRSARARQRASRAGHRRRSTSIVTAAPASRTPACRRSRTVVAAPPRRTGPRALGSSGRLVGVARRRREAACCTSVAGDVVTTDGFRRRKRRREPARSHGASMPPTAGGDNGRKRGEGQLPSVHAFNSDRASATPFPFDAVEVRPDERGWPANAPRRPAGARV